MRKEQNQGVRKVTFFNSQMALTSPRVKRILSDPTKAKELRKAVELVRSGKKGFISNVHSNDTKK